MPQSWMKPLAYAGVAGILLLTFQLHLLAALFSGLLVYEIVHILAGRLIGPNLSASGARTVAVIIIASTVVLLITGLTIAGVHYASTDEAGIGVLLNQMAQIIEDSRSTLPQWAIAYLPEDSEAMKAAAAEALRSNADILRTLGGDIGRSLVHILIGMIIGALVALHETQPEEHRKPLSRAWIEQVAHVGQAFRRVVFAQVRISALNTFLTWLYLAVVLPLFGVQLPLVKTMVLATFLLGLIPVLGNLMSNTIIAVISLSHSLVMMGVSLGYLVVIHKLEYFVNAKIIGSRIQAKAWELLTMMLLMESAFGIPGVIAAPVIYAYVKRELSEAGLI
ncbi:MAG: AI-2E family transporter [Gammaproteobacteria bacterium]|nr:AI-2E family transporter [Gammaproteobacteria bacterium]